jgi:hypothetical protein
MMAFEAEVQRGIALLDQKVPGWRKRIDLDRLDMIMGLPDSTGCGCILTQVFGNYWRGLRLLDFDGLDGGDDDYGFDVAGRDANESYHDLTAAWRRALTADGAP